MPWFNGNGPWDYATVLAGVANSSTWKHPYFHLIPFCQLDERTRIHEVELAFKSFHFNKHHACPCDLSVNMHG
jgi:hypothetical protein